MKGEPKLVQQIVTEQNHFHCVFDYVSLHDSQSYREIDPGKLKLKPNV